MCVISLRSISLVTFTSLLFLSAPACFSNESKAEPKAFSYKQWYGELGRSGLRRSLANTSDLGELANRAATYRLSKQQESIFNARQAVNPTNETFHFESDIDGWVAQVGSMQPLPSIGTRQTAIEGMLRTAQRQGQLIDVVSNHLDVGLVMDVKPLGNKAGYFALHGIIEQSDADVFFVNGRREGDSAGLRIQLGEVLGDTWAYQMKAERVWWSGDSYSYRGSALNPIRVEQPVDYARTYLNSDVIARYSLSTPWLPNAGLRWRSGIHYLQSDYENNRNNLGQAAIEPFGPTERLGIVRTGAVLFWRYGEQQQWSPLVELLYDYEFINNMDEVFTDPNTITLKLGVAWLPKVGQRAQFEVQRFQGLQGERVRNSLSLTILLDTF